MSGAFRACLLLSVLLVPLLAGGCATRSGASGTYATASDHLPKPSRVLVMDFAVDPERVGLEQAVSARVERELDGVPSTDTRVRIALQVQSAIAQALVREVRSMGLAAERGGADAIPRPGDVVITGHVTRIDEGNRTRRMVIGFGAGRSEVTASAALSQARAGESPRLLQTYDASSNSGRKPGFGVGAVSGAAEMAGLSGAAGAYGEVARNGVGAEGQRLAERLSYDLGTFFAEQGWIASAALPTQFVR